MHWSCRIGIHNFAVLDIVKKHELEDILNGYNVMYSLNLLYPKWLCRKVCVKCGKINDEIEKYRIVYLQAKEDMESRKNRATKIFKGIKGDKLNAI